MPGSSRILAMVLTACCALLWMTAAGHASSRNAAAPSAAPWVSPRFVSAAACPAMDGAELKTGKKIFSGQGNCYTCHGADAKGTPLAPDLTDTTWLQIDGSYDAIVGLITKGVPQPKEHPAPMPPMGGAQLSQEQVCAVGAYVYSLSHPDAADSSGARP